MSVRQPELVKRFRLPRQNRSHAEFLAAARATFLKDLTVALNQYDQAVHQFNAGQIVRRLDVINLYRFGGRLRRIR